MKAKKVNVRASFVSKVTYYKDVTMTEAEFEKTCSKIDAREVDAERLFSDFGLHLVDDANYSDVELDDFYIDEAPKK